jgi:hypothetical protein
VSGGDDETGPRLNCPSCGGTNRRLLAPGFYQCESQIESVVLDWAPAPGMIPGPGVPMVPIPSSLYRVCGNRYQEGSPIGNAPSCRCGMFAVGRCATCGLAVCGKDGEFVEGYLMCRAHAAESTKARAEAARPLQQEATKRARDESLVRYEASLKPWEAVRLALLARLGDINEPVERLLFALRHCGPGGRCVDSTVLSQAFPGLWSEGAVNLEAASPPWDSDAVAHWFAARARDADLPFVRIGPTGGRFKRRYRRGWLAGPSTVVIRFHEFADVEPYHVPIYVDGDGQRWTDGVSDDLLDAEKRLEAMGTAPIERRLHLTGTTVRGGNFSPAALVNMAIRFGLEDAAVELPPRPPAPSNIS